MVALSIAVQDAVAVAHADLDRMLTIAADHVLAKVQQQADLDRCTLPGDLRVVVGADPADRIEHQTIDLPHDPLLVAGQRDQLAELTGVRREQSAIVAASSGSGAAAIVTSIPQPVPSPFTLGK